MPCFWPASGFQPDHVGARIVGFTGVLGKRSDILTFGFRKMSHTIRQA